MIKASKDSLDGGPLLQTSTLPILAVTGLVDVEIYRFYQSRDFTRPRDQRVKSAKSGGHTSCGSGDMTYFNL